MIKKSVSIYIGILLAFSSCDYLDVKPAGQVIPETVTEYRALMTRGYDAYPPFKNLLSARADETFPSAQSSSAYGDYISVALWNEANPGEYTPSYPWTMMYNTIFYANSIIENIDGAEIDAKEDSREQLKAEALLMRAYVHFQLVNLYAAPYNRTTAATERGIPLSLKIDIEQKYIPQTVEEVYSQILSDIHTGEELMKVEQQPLETRYRFSRRAAKALEARVHLYRGDWQAALNAAESLMPCELEDMNAMGYISPYRYDSKEAIMTLDEVTDRYFMKGSLYIIANLVDKYNKTGDRRFTDYYIENNGQYWPKKGYGDNVRMTFRSGEIYLIAAEAAAHLDGQLDVSKNYLKQLMEKRLTTDYYSKKVVEVDNMNQEQLLAEIADERARELALEGHRWFDLRRTTRPEIVKEYTDQEGVRQTAVLHKDDPRYTIRFPKEATANNPELN